LLVRLFLISVDSCTMALREGKDETDATVRQAELFSQLMTADPGNQRCAECGAARPTWASVPLGIFLCLGCASKHRGYGVQASFVRSLTLDRWQIPQQTEYLRLGGNTRFREFFAAEDHALPDEHQCRCDVCDRYRALLAADVRKELGISETDDKGEEFPLPHPRGGIQNSSSTSQSPEEASSSLQQSSQPTSTQPVTSSSYHRRVIGMNKTHVDEDEERRLFGESLRDPEPGGFFDCFNSCCCTLL